MSTLTNETNQFTPVSQEQSDGQAQKKPIQRINIKDNIPDAPVSASCTLPLCYVFSPTKAIKRTIDAKENKYEFIAPCPVFITNRGVNPKTQKETVELAWIRDEEWKFIEVDRSCICKHTKIVDLADYGFPVTSDSAKDIASYLRLYEDVNLEHIPVTTITSQMGWNKEGRCFLLGKDCIVPSSEVCPCEDVCPYERQPYKSYKFRAIDTGEEQIAFSLHSAGTYKQWVEGINTIFDFPVVLFTFYTALTAPFLRIFGCENFSYEISSPTSTGKTFTLQIAGSCWGKPHENAGGFFRTWKTTSTAIERVLQSVNGIPVIFDDTKNALGIDKYKKGSTPLVVETIYMVSTGIGKSRGTLAGSEENVSYSTIMMSSGESPSIDMTNDGGSRGRIISLWTLPFKTQSKEISNYISYLSEILNGNYGHAAPRLIHFMLDNRQHWSLWKESYQEVSSMLFSKDNLNPVQRRISKNIAAIVTAIPLIHAAMPELNREFDLKSIIKEISDIALKESVIPDNGSRFIQYLSEYINENPGIIHTKENFSKKQGVSVSDISIYSDFDGKNWTFLGISTEVLKRILKENQLDKSEVLRTLQTKKWLDSNESTSGSQRQVIIPLGLPKNPKKNLYCFKSEAFKSINLSFENVI